MCSEFRVPVQCQVFVDSGAALGVVSRRGVGRVRHLKLGHLWIQEVAHRGELAYHKVGGDSNVADLMTKHLKGERVRHLTQQIGCAFRTGSARARLQLAAYLFGPSPPCGPTPNPSGEDGAGISAGDGPRRGARSCSQPMVSPASQGVRTVSHTFPVAISASNVRVPSR